MQPSQEFINTAIEYVQDMISHGLFGYPVTGIRFQVQYEPSTEQLRLLKVSPGQTLLGMYSSNPPTVTLFEKGIRAVIMYPEQMPDTVDEVLRHEIYYHHLGYNHTAREGP